ncbi:MAG: ribonuclease J [Bacilli bacterium]
MSKIKIFALGGLNENGKNMYVVEVNDDIFVFDAGLKYGIDKNLGVDYIIPSFNYLMENEKRVKGIFLSHGHETHIGAVPDILTKLPNIPIYATKYTMEILKMELDLYKIPANNLHEIKPHSKIIINNMVLFPISVSHSIPDAVAYVLYTDDGAIVYTGDYVFDSSMTGNYKTDIGKLAYVGKQGVLCLLSESLYAEKPGHTSPNNRITEFIKDVFNKNENRIIATVLSAHIYRVQELFNEIMKTHRNVIIMGKSLQELIIKSIDSGYITFDKTRIKDLYHLDDKGIIVLISDEKEKPFANLERIVKGFDKYIKIKETDTVFITEPPYDGIEKRLAVLMDEVAMLNANCVSLNKKHLLHHASREDLMMMLDLMNPKYYFPVKGEYRHQYANATVAEEIGMKKENILLKLNGDVVTFIDGELTEDLEKVEADSILIDGNSTDNIGALVIKDREMLGENGIVIVNATLDKKTKTILAGPEIITKGFVFINDNKELINETKEVCLKIINNNIDKAVLKVDYSNIKSDVRDVLSKLYYKRLDSKPVIITVIQEV